MIEGVPDNLPLKHPLVLTHFPDPVTFHLVCLLVDRHCLLTGQPASVWLVPLKSTSYALATQICIKRKSDCVTPT